MPPFLYSTKQHAHIKCKHLYDSTPRPPLSLTHLVCRVRQQAQLVCCEVLSQQRVERPPNAVALHQVGRDRHGIGVGHHRRVEGIESNTKHIGKVARVHHREDLGKVLAKLLALAVFFFVGVVVGGCLVVEVRGQGQRKMRQG